MPASIREIHVERTSRLDDYEGYDHLSAPVSVIRRLGMQVSHALGPHRVWMLNSTASGGGVAEMLPRLCSLLSDVGVDTRWLVLEPNDPDFFQVTKALHNQLHGEPAPFPDGARGLYERVSREAAEHLCHIDPNDVLVAHDPQPAGIASFIPIARRPHVGWRCHVGVAEHNDYTASAWDFLRPYLDCYRRLVFSAMPYIPSEYLDRSGIVAPSIDPMSHKNRELRTYKLLGVLRAAGLLCDTPALSWSRFDPPALVYRRGSGWTADGIPDLLFRPYALQVSRFDRLKGFDLTIPAFARMRELLPERVAHMRADTERMSAELEALQLVLAGPDPMAIADDPEATAVLAELQRQHDALPDAIAKRVHLVRLPMVNVKQNALTVNALQRAASLVLQCSIREGFGLTVTEALWKAVPVVASNVGGIAVQVRDGIDGLLVHDPRDPERIAEAMLHVLSRPHEAERMGRSAHVRVRDHFLMLVQVRTTLEQLLSGLAEIAAERETQVSTARTAMGEATFATAP